MISICAILSLAGCGGGTETPQSIATKTTVTGSITANESGTITVSTPVPSPLGNTLTIQANTLLTEDAAGAIPVTGSITTTASYSANGADLPASAMTLPAGATLAAFMDIDLGAVKYFSKPMRMILNVVSGGAGVGTIVAFYTFDTNTNLWEPVDNSTVAQDGTASLSIHHLSIYAAFKTNTPPPGKPSGSSATAGNAKVTVSWTAPQTGPAPSAYNIYYSTAAGISKATAIKLENVTSPYEVTGLSNGTPYYFAIAAVNANGEGGLSSEETATPDVSLQPPASPNGVTATAGTGKVTVQWNTKLYATSYNIYYSASGTITPANLLASGTKVTVAANPDPQPLTHSTEIDGLTPGTIYSFVVTAENASGESAPQSSTKKATPN